MKRVLFNKIHQDFSLKTHIPFGPWCFIGQEDQIDWEKHKFPKDAFSTKKDFQLAQDNVEIVIDFLFPKLCNYLNQENDQEKSPEFWRVMIMPWLSLFVQNVVSNYYRLLRFLDNQGENFIFECTNTNLPPFKKTIDFILNGIGSVDYNEWVYSEIIRKCFPKLKTDISPQQRRHHYQEAETRNNFKFKLKYFIKNLLAFKSVYGINFLDSIRFSFFVKKRKPNKTNEYIQRQKTSSCFLPAMQWLSTSKECLPKSFLNIHLFSTCSYTPNYRFQVLSGSLLYTEEEQKYQLARYVEKGGTLVPCQHGSNYGILSTFLWIKQIEYSHLNYISWGWEKHQGSKLNATALPSPLIWQFKNKHVRYKKNSDIILVGTPTYPFYHFILSYKQPNKIIKYRQDKISFLASLSSKNFKRLKYRDHPVGNLQLLKDKEYVQTKFPNINMCEGDLHPQLGQAALVVSDNPGTTFFITIGANVPTIGFWDPKDALFTEDAETLFLHLKQQKIVFDTPEAATEHINQISDDIAGWWKNEKVQEARIAWCNKFARTSKNWKKEWKQAIKKLNEEILPL